MPKHSSTTDYMIYGYDGTRQSNYSGISVTRKMSLVYKFGVIK